MPNLRSKDPNMMLYGRSPRKMAPDLLPQYADVDLSVEFYKQSGSGEWEAIKRKTGDLLSIYSRTLLKIQDLKKKVSTGLFLIRHPGKQSKHMYQQVGLINIEL